MRFDEVSSSEIWLLVGLVIFAVEEGKKSKGERETEPLQQ